MLLKKQLYLHNTTNQKKIKDRWMDNKYVTYIQVQVPDIPLDKRLAQFETEH